MRELQRSIYFFIALCLCCSSCQPGDHAGEQVIYGDDPGAGSFVQVRGMKMYYEKYGDGPPLLMIHGNGGSIKSFKNNIAFFDNTFQVVATDSRAQGKSNDYQDSLSFEMMADDEAALMDSLHLDSAYIIGWSDGGIIALEMAMRYPEKIKKIAISGANLWPDSTAIRPESWLESKAYYDSHRDSVWKSAKEKNNWKLFKLNWDAPNISLASLGKIQCPALVIAGEDDVIRKDHTLMIADAIKNAKLWIVPNSGHATLIDHPNEFNEKVAEFFNGRFSEVR